MSHRPDDDPAALSRLAGPEGASAFLDSCELKTRWKHRGDAATARALLPWAAFDRLVSEGRLSPERFHIIVNQNHVSPSLFVDAASGRLRGGAIQGMAEQGATFLIVGVQDLVPAVGTLVSAIEQMLGASIQANAYLSFGEYSAFDAHRDDHDVLVVQIHGSKRWRGYGSPTPFPLKGGAFPGRAVEWEDVLEPGDLLYLPRGEVHAAVPVDRPSVHLTIGIRERTGVDFVRALADAVEAEELFRHSLSRGDVAAQEEALKAALHALIDSASLDDFLSRDDGERRLRPANAFHFAERLTPDTLLAATLLRAVPLHPETPGEVKLVLGGQGIRLGQLERRALDLLARRGQASVAALALDLKADDGELAAALAKLATHALVEIRA